MRNFYATFRRNLQEQTAAYLYKNSKPPHSLCKNNAKALDQMALRVSFRPSKRTRVNR